MLKNLILLLCLFFAKQVWAQDKSFFAKGYILYHHDTTRCRIWLNPDSPYFISELTVWINDTTRTISLSRNDSLSGFGIIEQGYEQHLGKIKAELPWKTVHLYVPKLVTGPVEIFEHVFTMTSTNRTTEVTRKENYVNYYIGKTASDDHRAPVLVKSFAIKKLSRYFEGLPELEKITTQKITPGQLIDLARAYNDWYLQKKQNGN